VAEAERLLLARIRAPRKAEDGVDAVERLQSRSTTSDFVPLFTATAIEVLLAWFFRPGGKVPRHPGSNTLTELLLRRKEQGLRRLWFALTGAQVASTLQSVLYPNATFKWGKTFVLVPLDRAVSCAFALHQFMEILCAAKLAQTSNLSEPNGLTRRILASGYPEETKAALFAAPSVKVYTLTQAQLLAIIVDDLSSGSGAEAPFAATETSATER
jgi:hypothetical protein